MIKIDISRKGYHQPGYIEFTVVSFVSLKALRQRKTEYQARYTSHKGSNIPQAGNSHNIPHSTHNHAQQEEPE